MFFVLAGLVALVGGWKNENIYLLLTGVCLIIAGLTHL